MKGYWALGKLNGRRLWRALISSHSFFEGFLNAKSDISHMFCRVFLLFIHGLSFLSVKIIIFHKKRLFGDALPSSKHDHMRAALMLASQLLIIDPVSLYCLIDPLNNGKTDAASSFLMKNEKIAISQKPDFQKRPTPPQ